MTYANHDLERQVAEAVTTPAIARVLVVAQSPAVGATMLEEMQSDQAVRGTLLECSLTQAVADNAQAWSGLNFVVFELSNSIAEDIVAVQKIKSQGDNAPHCIAMTRDVLTDEQRARLTQTGVAEIISLPPREEQKKAPEAPTEEPHQDVVEPPLEPAASAHVSLPQEKQRGCVTVLLRARGGAGATTLAVNLAAAQADIGGAGSVALLDLDIQNGAIALAMDLPDSAEAGALIKGELPLSAAFIDRAMVRHNSGVDVLTAPDIFAPLDALSPSDVAAMITMLKDRYDHIVVDMPQAVTDWTLPVLGAAAQVILVTDTSLPSIKRTRRLIDLIGDEHMTLPVEVVVNQQQKPLRLSAALRECEALIGRSLTHWVPLDVKTARRASDLGIPIQMSAKRSRMARAITALAGRMFAPKSSSAPETTQGQHNHV